MKENYDAVKEQRSEDFTTNLLERVKKVRAEATIGKPSTTLGEPGEGAFGTQPIGLPRRK